MVVKRCTIGLICIVFSLAALQYEMLKSGNQFLYGYQHFEAASIHPPFESVELVTGFGFVPTHVAGTFSKHRHVFKNVTEITIAPEADSQLFVRRLVLRL